MQRMTRAKAAELAGDVVIPADANMDDHVASTYDAAHRRTPEPPSHRKPLGEIAPNSAESSGNAEDEARVLRKSTRGKGNGKKLAAKNRSEPSPINVASNPITPDEGPLVLPDELDSSSPSASEPAAAELFEEDIEATPQASVHETGAQTPSAAAGRLTKRQLAKETATSGTAEAKGFFEVIENAAMEALNTAASSTLDAPASPHPSAMPNVIKALRKDTPAKRSTSNKENVAPGYDALEHAAVQSTTSPRSEQRLSGRPEDHIDALDKLDDALETVRGSIPHVCASPEKQRKKRVSTEISEAPVVAAAKSKPVPIVKATKASQARLSMIQGRQRLPSLGAPRASIGLGRSASVRVASSKPAGAAARSTSASTNKDNKSSPAAEVKKEVAIPHGKPRPVSISFPTPPPPRRSSKAPTQSTFRLPGEAIAEKLKAQREARMAQEPTETSVKRTFKARPVPSSLKTGPIVRQTNTSKARTSMMGPSDSNRSVSGTSLDPKRISSATSSSSNTTKPRQPSADSTVRATTTATTAMPYRKPSATTANVSKARAPAAGSNTTTARVPSTGSTVGTSKGKVVLERITKSHENAEKERREQAEATAKARIAASERGRQASREWAEKQRLKGLAAAKPEAAVHN